MSALTLGLIAALCWGFHDICVRYLSQKTAISACIVTVLGVGLVFHLGLMGATGTFATISATAVWLSVAAGLFFVLATFALYGAFQRGPVRLVAPLIASFPILSVGLAALRGTAVTPAQWAAVLTIVIGVSIVAALSDTDEDHAPSKPLTILFSLAAAVGFAGTFALGQEAAAISHLEPSTLVTRITAITLAALIVAIARQPFWPGRRALLVLIAMGCADGVALYAVLSAGGLPNAEYAAVASSIFGLLTILMAWAFLREKMTPPQWMGCALAFVGIGYLAL